MNDYSALERAAIEYIIHGKTRELKHMLKFTVILKCVC